MNANQRSRILVGVEADFTEGVRVILTTGDHEIGVLRHAGAFHAFRNLCPHQGGPVCEGIVIGRVDVRIEADRRVTAHGFSDQEPHLVCPWHGYEYDLRTGVNAADSTKRLLRYEVEIEGDHVYVWV